MFASTPNRCFGLYTFFYCLKSQRRRERYRLFILPLSAVLSWTWTVLDIFSSLPLSLCTFLSLSIPCLCFYNSMSIFIRKILRFIALFFLHCPILWPFNFVFIFLHNHRKNKWPWWGKTIIRHFVHKLRFAFCVLPWFK